MTRSDHLGMLAAASFYGFTLGAAAYLGYLARTFTHRPRKIGV